MSRYFRAWALRLRPLGLGVWCWMVSLLGIVPGAGAAVDLTVSVADTPDPVLAGGDLNYSIEVFNRGPDEATSVILTSLVSQVTLLTIVPSQGSCTHTAGVVTCTFGTLARFGFATLALTARTLRPGAITNTVSAVSDQVDQAPADNLARQVTTVVQTHPPFANSEFIDISEDSVTAPYPSLVQVSGLAAVIGKVTVTLNNLNHIFPDDLDILLLGPRGQNVMLISDAGGGDSLINTTLTLDDDSPNSLSTGLLIEPGTYAPTNFGAADPLAAPAPAGPYGGRLAAFRGTDPNGAWRLFIHDDQLDDGGFLADGWSLNIATAEPIVDLGLAMTGAPNPVLAGQNLVYSLGVTNRGPAPATGVILSDRLPPGVTFVSASPSQGSCVVHSNVVTCTLSNLAAGATAAVVLTVVPTAGALLTNSASVGSLDADLVPANNEAVVVIPLNSPPSITDQPQPQRVSQGGTAAFVVGAAGTPPLSYQWRFEGVDLPGQTGPTLTLNNVQPQNAGNYWVLASNVFGAVESQPAPLTVVVPPVITSQPHSQTNLVATPAFFTVEATGSEPLAYQWLFNLTPLPGATNATLGLPSVQPGQAGRYQVAVANSAGSIVSASATLVVLAVDFGDAPDPSFPTLLANNGARHLIVAGLHLGTRIDFEPDGLPNATATGDDDAGLADDDGIILRSPLLLGQPTTLEAVASAAGLLNGWIDLDGNGGWSEPGEQVFTNRSLTAGTNLLTVHVPAGAPPGLRLSRFRFSTAGDLGFQGEAMDGEVEDYALPVSSALDLSVSLTGTPDPIAVGQTLLYSISLSNHGPSAATGVLLSNQLPKSVQFLSATPSQGSCSVQGSLVLCALGEVAVGGSASLALQVTPVTTGRATNRVSVSAAQSDFSLANNTASTITTVGQAADLVLRQTVSPSSVLLGQEIAFTMVVSNRGPNSAHGVTLLDLVPAGATVLTFEGAEDCSAQASEYTCNLGDLPAGASVTVTLRVLPGRSGLLTNRVEVAAVELDMNPLDNSSQSVASVTLGSAQFANTNSLPLPSQGPAATYPSTLLITSLTTTVHRVTVTLHRLAHTFPDDLDLLLVGPRGQAVLLMSDVGGGNRLTNATLSFDDEAPLALPDSFEVTSGVYRPANYGTDPDPFPLPAPAGPFAGALSVFSGTDGNGLWSLYVVDDEAGDTGLVAGGWSLAFTLLQPIADLALAQADSPDPVAVEGTNVYVLTVTNLGPSPAGNVTLRDLLPPQATFVSAQASQGGCVASDGTVTCSLGGLAVGGAATVLIAARPAAAGTLTNNASVTSSTLDPRASNNVSTATTAALDPPSILQQPQPRFAALGDSASFSVTAAGPEPLTFQWRFNGVNLPGATNASLILGNVTLEQQGNYSVRVGGLVGSTLSVEAALTIRQRPTLSAIPPQTIDEDTATPLLPFTAADAESPASSLVVSAASSNPSLAPPDRILLDGSGAERTVRVVPLPDQFGIALITLMVTDGDGITGSTSFQVTVNPLNDPPIISSIPDQVTPEDQPVGPIPFLVADPDNPPDSLLLTATSSQPGLLPVANITFGGTGTNRTLTLTPALEQSGSATVTLSVGDGEFNASIRFILNVILPNDAPSLSVIPPQTTDEDMPTAPIPFTVTDPESPASALAVAGSSSNPGLVPVSGIVLGGDGTNRTVTLRPATNQVGTALITLTASDGFIQASRDFQFTVLPVDDPPVLAGLANHVINEDATLVLSFALEDADESAPSAMLTGVSSNPALIPDANMVFSGSGGQRSMAVTPVLDRSGAATLEMIANDGHYLSTGAVHVTVLAVNDPPTLDPLRDVVIAEDAPEQTLSLLGIGSGAADEIDTLTLTALSSAPELIPTPTVLYTNLAVAGLLRFRPATDAVGRAVITVSVNDNRPSNNIVTRRFAVTILPASDPPLISVIANQSTPEDTPLAVPFMVRDPDTDPSALTVTASSSNPALMPDANLVVDGTGTNRTLRLIPGTNSLGVVQISLTVRDPEGLTAGTDFSLTIQTANDLPTLDPIADRFLTQNPPNLSITLTGISSGASNETQALVLTASSSNPGLVPNPQVTYSSPGTNGQLTINPANNITGVATMAAIVADSQGGSVTQRFNIYVRNTANAPPTISLISNQSTFEDTPTPLIPFTISDTGTAANLLTLLGTSSNPSLIGSNNIVFGGGGNDRTVTLIPLPDRSGTALITVTVVDSAFGATNRSFLFTVSPTNDPPTLDALADLIVNADAGPQTVPLTGIGPGAANESQPLAVSATSSDPLLIPHPTVLYSSPAATGALVFTPAPGAHGTATLTVTVNDPQNGLSSRPFNVVVNAPPSIAGPSDLSGLEDGTIGPVPFTVGDTETPVSALLFTARSSNPALVPDGNVAVSGTGAERALTITPLPDQFGASAISAVVTDGHGLTATQNLVLIIQPANDPPRFTKGPDQTVPEDSGARLVSNWATDISPGPATESAQAAHFLVSSDQPGLFAAPPAVAPNGALTFTPAPNAHGSALITVQLRDNGGTANGGVDTSEAQTFTLTLTPLNDPPSISLLMDQNRPEDPPGIAVAFVVEDAETPLPSLSLAAASSNPLLVPNENLFLAGTGLFRTLNFVPLLNQSGTSMITVTVTDGDNASASANFMLNVRSVNDAPTLAPLSSLALGLAAGPQTVNLTGISSGAPDEVQSLQLTALSSRPELVPHPTVEYTSPNSTGTLSFTPANVSGSALITVTVRDDGGTTDGGQDSFMRTFSIILSPSDPPLLSITRLGIIASLSFDTISGIQYVLEFKDDLEDAEWTPLVTVAGDGSRQTIPDVMIPDTSRYYRVRLQ